MARSCRICYNSQRKRNWYIIELKMDIIIQLLWPQDSLALSWTRLQELVGRVQICKIRSQQLDKEIGSNENYWTGNLNFAFFKVGLRSTSLPTDTPLHCDKIEM